MRERKVRGWPYWVSDQGDVRSQYGKLTPAPDKDGYLYVTLSHLGRRWRVAVHVLVLTAFHGKRPPGCEGCHGESGQRVNAITNLRWGTHRENIRDKLRADIEVAAGSHPENAVTGVKVSDQR